MTQPTPTVTFLPRTTLAVVFSSQTTSPSILSVIEALLGPDGEQPGQAAERGGGLAHHDPLAADLARARRSVHGDVDVAGVQQAGDVEAALARERLGVTVPADAQEALQLDLVCGDAAAHREVPLHDEPADARTVADARVAVDRRTRSPAPRR